MWPTLKSFIHQSTQPYIHPFIRLSINQLKHWSIRYSYTHSLIDSPFIKLINHSVIHSSNHLFINPPNHIHPFIRLSINQLKHWSIRYSYTHSLIDSSFTKFINHSVIHLSNHHSLSHLFINLPNHISIHSSDYRLIN